MARVVPAWVDPAETKRQSTTRVTLHVTRSNPRLRDYSLVERFVLDYARYPELPGDGPAHRALLHARVANLAAQARSVRQPWGSGTVEAWRRRTAAETLVRIAKLSSAAQQILGQAISKVVR